MPHVSFRREEKLNIAEMLADIGVPQIEAGFPAVSEAEKLGYEAKKIAEEERAEMEKMTRKADIIVSAEIEKEKIEIEASAIAQKERLIAQGKADAKLRQMEAEALGFRRAFRWRGEVTE